MEPAFDDLNIKKFDLSEEVDKLDLITPKFEEHSCSGASSFQVGLDLDSVYDLDLNLYECGFEDSDSSLEIYILMVSY